MAKVITMRTMRRISGVVAIVLLVGLSAVGSMPVRAAVSPLDYEDPAGDALDTRASMDILKVTHDVRQINKTGPPSLVYELTLGAPPESQLVTYGMEGDAGPCFVDAAFRPGTVFTQVVGTGAAQFFVGCEGMESELIDAKSLIKGNVLTMSIALDSLPKPAREAGELKNLYSFTQTAEPVTGIFGNGDQDLGMPGVLPTDSATTDKTFNFAG